jgi:predicted O-linked N-acetylglucosamine transferase (SPINDLY family)
MGPLREFLDLLQGIDIALDPFPYGGGTTTMHCLWMGVPVISLAGTRAFSRNAVGPLSEVGLKELIATEIGTYIEIACDLAADMQRLTAMRQSLRSKMTSSALMAQSLFARNMETLLRSMWREYCAAA